MRDCANALAPAPLLAEWSVLALRAGDQATALQAERTRYELAVAHHAERLRADAANRLGVVIGESDRPIPLARFYEAAEAYVELGADVEAATAYSPASGIYSAQRDPLNAALACIEHFRLRDELLSHFARGEKRLRTERLEREKTVAELERLIGDPTRCSNCS